MEKQDPKSSAEFRLRSSDKFKTLQDEYCRLIRDNNVPYAENILRQSDWLIYAYHCYLVEIFLPDKNSKIIDWGGQYGHVAQILREMGYANCFNYLLNQSDAYGLFLDHFSIPTIFGNEPNRLNLDDASVDALISSGVLEHVREDGIGDDRAIVTDIARVLRSDGLFFIWNLPSTLSISDMLARRMGHYWHRHRYKKDEILKILGAAGFDVIFFDKSRLIPGSLMEKLGRSDMLRALSVDDRLSHIFPLNLFANSYSLIARKRA